MVGLSEDLLKMGSVVSPSECVVFGDTVGWMFVSVYSRSTLLANSTLATPSLSPNSEFGIVPHYTFCLTLLRFGQAKIAFLDGHVEALTPRGLTLPAQSAHRRWHDDGHAHLDRLVYLPLIVLLVIVCEAVLPFCGLGDKKSPPTNRRACAS